MEPVGYVVSRHSSFGRGAAKAFQRWLDSAPNVYAKSVLNRPAPTGTDNLDKFRISKLKDYRSLMPMAQEARKPMFLLRPADGAIGGHQMAVADCYRDFEQLANEIERRIGLDPDRRREASA